MRARGLGLMSAAGCAFLVSCAPARPDGGSNEGDEPVQASPLFAGDPANNAVFALDISMWEGPMSQKEMDCFWDSGARHIVVGTQYEEITRQQLAMAVSRGMSVDGYVYLYWNTDTRAQVDLAFQRTAGFPIGRMWLDIEQPPGPNDKLMSRMADALDECRKHTGIDCGVYTGPGFWKTYTGNAKALSDAPLWYALYNKKTSLSDWSTEKFGGWQSPVAKQFTDQAICGVGADSDVMQIVAQPTIQVDRSTPPDTGAPPPAPSGLFPPDGSVEMLDYVKIMSNTLPLATSYQLALERWNGSSFVSFATWTNANGFQKVYPVAGSLYRFRVRAMNAHGWGAWSSYASFDFGKYTGPRPAMTPPPSSPTAPSSTPPPSAPPPTGVPGSLSPDGGVSVAGASVAMTCSTVSGATSYDFAIEHESGGSFSPYYTYSSTGPSRSFYPQLSGTYRWRVRADTGSANGAWSSYATFVHP